MIRPFISVLVFTFAAPAAASGQCTTASPVQSVQFSFVNDAPPANQRVKVALRRPQAGTRMARARPDIGAWELPLGAAVPLSQVDFEPAVDGFHAHQSAPPVAMVDGNGQCTAEYTFQLDRQWKVEVASIPQPVRIRPMVLRGNQRRTLPEQPTTYKFPPLDWGETLVLQIYAPTSPTTSEAYEVRLRADELRNKPGHELVHGRNDIAHGICARVRNPTMCEAYRATRTIDSITFRFVEQ
ncbi:MAG TPA: hypothetical protein VJT67_03210 [Longimicrobiaceae bacterium]|nr:hypothetical protein [Longimicrobiaceae bacterium]